MAVKITAFEAENVKRVKAVALEPAQTGLTVIGGKNGQGKTSVLDAIAWALGGDKYRPSEAQREGSTIPPSLHVELSNGLIVERKGKNSDLKVIDPSGRRAGQTLLNGFIEQLALDLPRFMQMSSKDKALTLLNIIGIGDELYQLDRQEQTLYNQRRTIGQIADQKKKYAVELPMYTGVPSEPISASELIQQQQEILARNGENQRKRQFRDDLTVKYDRIVKDIAALYSQIQALEEQRDQLGADLEIAQKSANELVDESTAELEKSIRDIETVNVKIRSNLERERAEDEAAEYSRQYDALTDQISGIRIKRLQLLDGADLPLPGLSVVDGELTYNGKMWDCMSGSDQLIVATSIVRKLNPECGFVLLDKLEQMDRDTLHMFNVWLEAQDLQVIGTRVSTGDECSIIISDGYVEGTESVPAVKSATDYWN